MAIIWIIYLALGYWAVGRTIWKNKVFIEFKQGTVFTRRVILGALLGWALIPVAILGMLFGK